MNELSIYFFKLKNKTIHDLRYKRRVVFSPYSISNQQVALNPKK